MTDLTAGEQARVIRIRRTCETFAALMTAELGDGPELAEGLEHFTHAQACFARAALPARERTQPCPH